MKYFKLSEFDSPDRPGSGKMMNSGTLAKLDRAREIAGIPFKINSGYRTKEHNDKINGASNSAHLRGHAADIACTTAADRDKLIRALIAVGFTRIGIADTFVHADDDPQLPQNRIWLY